MAESNLTRTEEYLESARHSLIYNEEFSPADWYFSPDKAGYCWGLLSRAGSSDHTVGLVPAPKDLDAKAILDTLADEFFQRHHDSRTAVRLTLVAVVEGEEQHKLVSLVGHRAQGRNTVYYIAVDALSGRIASPQEYKPNLPGARSIGLSPADEVVRIPMEQPIDERAEQEKARRYFRQRARRSMYEGGRMPSLGRPSVTYAIIAINVVMFLVAELMGGSTRTTTLVVLGAKVTQLIQMGQWWRIFTYQFLHIGMAHLFVNGYSLLNLGPLIEEVYGRWQFLGIYLLSGAMGGLASAAFSPRSISAGASGALFGLLGATTAWMMAGQVSWDSIWRTVGYPVLATIGYGLFLRIDHYAHFGGLAGGFLLATAIGLGYRTKSSARVVAIAAFAALSVLLVFLIIR